MSYDFLERSNYDGIPTTLYEFALGTNIWRYSSGEQSVTVGGQMYEAVPISDSGIVQSGDVQADDFIVTMPANNEFAALFRATPPSEGVVVTVRRLNRGETEAPIVWVGALRSTKRVTQIAVDLICKSLSASLNRNGLRLAWGKGCPHALYDRNCRVNKDLYDTAIQITQLTGAVLISPSFESLPAGYLAGGFFEWELLPGLKERRAIESQSGSVVVVLGTTDGIVPGQWLTFYPGCDRVTSTCETKFNNLANYGGFPHLPSKSPFDGNPVY